MMDFSNKILSSMNHDRKVTKLYCDMKLEVGKATFDVHRCVLGSLSEYFDRMFRSGMQEGDASSIKIVGPLGEEISDETMSLILTYAYTNEISLTHSNVYDIILAVDYMDFPCLKKTCSDFLINNMALGTCIQNYLVASRLNVTELLDSSTKFIVENFHLLHQTRAFKELDMDQLKIVLKLWTRPENGLSEIIKYESLKSWISFECNERNSHSADLLSCVAFEKMPFKVLQSLFKSDGLIKESGHAMVCIIEMLLERQLFLNAALEDYARGNQPVTDSKIWMFGGYCKPHQYVEFNIKTRKFNGFSNRPRLAYPVIGAFAANVDDTIYIASGKKIQRITTRGPAPAAVAEISVTRNFCSGAYVDGYFYVVGGRDSTVIHKSIEVYVPSLSTMNLFGNLRQPRYKHAVVSLDTELFILGGTDVSDKAFAGVECFDTVTRKSKNISPMGACRKDLCAVALKGYIIAIGGCNENEEILNTVELYNPKNKKWSTLSPMICARAGASACLVNGMIYVVGGKGSSYDETSIECYNLILNKWTTVVDMSVSRYHATCVVVDY